MARLTSTDFHNCFTVIPNSADGNCLFESIEYLLSGSLYELDHGKLTAAEIREMVGNFYREFDKNIDYPESTIEYTIKMGIIFDNIDEEMPHDYNIWNDKVWASMTDVLICAVLFEININLYKYNKNTDCYYIEKIKPQYNYINTVNLLYNGINHFEALDTECLYTYKNSVLLANK